MPPRKQATPWRSGLEEAVAHQLEVAGVPASFEQHVIPYTEPETPHRYTPDFVLPNGIIVETKGIFDTADRKKHKLVKAQHPALDIRFVFSRSAAKIGKKSPTSYAMWCVRFGFKYADKFIPAEWLKERPNRASLAAIRKLAKEKA